MVEGIEEPGKPGIGPRIENPAPVLIVPGYGSPAFQTELVSKKLRSVGLDTIGVKLPWLAMGDMRRSAEVLAQQVYRAREYRGIESVSFLGFSLGGLVARFYLQEMKGYPHLSRAAFISAPNAGTYFGYLGFFSPAGRQVRPGSEFIEALNDSELAGSIASRCLSIFVRWDGVILPCFSSFLPDGYNLMLRKPVAHFRACMSDETILRASEFLLGDVPDGARHGRELDMLEAGRLVTVPAEVRPRRHYWAVAARPFISLYGRLGSLFRR